MHNEQKKTGKSVVGFVSSDKMTGTVAVRVERFVDHPLYKKKIRRTTKLYVDDPNNLCRVGDKVRVKSCRPLSKLKAWELVEVLSKQGDQ